MTQWQVTVSQKRAIEGIYSNKAVCMQLLDEPLKILITIINTLKKRVETEAENDYLRKNIFDGVLDH